MPQAKDPTDVASLNRPICPTNSIGNCPKLTHFCKHKTKQADACFSVNAILKPLDFQSYQQLQSAFANYGGNLQLGNQSFPFSNVELSKPTGKYVARAFLKLATLLSAKGYVQYAGNACSPGLQFPELHQLSNLQASDKSNCGVMIINVLGNPVVSGAVTLEAEPFMNLPIQSHWKTFDDYVQSMSSKYRIRTNKVLSNTSEYTSRELKHTEANEWIPQCAQMLGHTLKDKTLAISPNLSMMLHTFVRAMKDKFKVWGYYKDGQLCGFISAIESEHGLYAMHLGLTDKAAEDQLYQRMIYGVIAYGIEQKDEFVCLGRTATEIKSTMGATPIENSYILYAKSKILRGVINLYAKRFHRVKPYQLRNPFKG